MQPDDAMVPWPMPVEAFLGRGLLQRADVVLTLQRGSFQSWLIRWGTRSRFSHAALVFLVPKYELGFNNTFIIEAAGGGVDLTNVADYFSDRRTVVAIRRLERPWFDADAQRFVRGRMLNAIKSRYAYSQILRIVGHTFRSIAYGVRKRVSEASTTLRAARPDRTTAPNEFICSGFVQTGFVEGVIELIELGKLRPSVISDVFFNKDLADILDRTEWDAHTPGDQMEIVNGFAYGFADELQALTPADLANSDRLSWKYVIRDGLVYPVATADEAYAIIDGQQAAPEGPGPQVP